MKDINYYSNVPVRYPAKEDFTTFDVVNVSKLENQHEGICRDQLEFYGFKAPLMIGKDVNKAVQTVRGEDFVVYRRYDKEGYDKRMKEYRNEQNRLLSEFVQDLAVHHGYQPDSPIAQVIYSKAWDDGHANGLHEVMNCYDELTYFADEILKASDEWKDK